MRLERRACDLSQGIVALRRRGTDGLECAVIISRGGERKQDGVMENEEDAKVVTGREVVASGLRCRLQSSRGPFS